MLEERLTAQLLAGERARDPVAGVERLLAMQGQDRRGFRLALRVRTAGVAASDVDRALGERSLVVTWLNRGTLHLVRAEDYGWLHALTTPQLAVANRTRLAGEGIDGAAAARGVDAIVRALAADGPLSRRELGERIASAGIATSANGALQLVLCASLQGHVVRGPVVGGEHAYVLVRDWLGEPVAVDRDAALAELARRYLAGHGPAGDRDLAKWAGIGLRDARRGLSAIAPNLVELDGGLVDLAGRARAAPLPPPRLLGAFDPVLLGWANRDFVLGGRARIVAVNGLFRPFALVRGRAAATWSLAGDEVALEAFAPLARRDAAEADAVVAFLRS